CLSGGLGLAQSHGAFGSAAVRSAVVETHFPAPSFNGSISHYPANRLTTSSPTITTSIAIRSNLKERSSGLALMALYTNLIDSPSVKRTLVIICQRRRSSAG